MHFQKKQTALIFMVVAAAFVLTTVLTGCQGEQETADSHLKKGTEYFSAKSYQKARIEFLNAAQLAPDNPNAWYQLGETQIRLGNAREAFQAYSKAENLDPDNPDILLKTASFLMLSNQMAMAEKKIKKILANDPENTQALFLNARILAQKGELGQAEALFEKVLSLAPNHVNALEKLAAIKTFQKDFNGAEQLLLRAVKIDEKNLTPRMILVSFYAKTKAFDKAEAQLITAGKLNPDSVDIPIYMGNFYMAMQNQEAAEKAYIRALEIAPDMVKPHVAAARFYESIDNNDKALRLYTQALDLHPDNLSLKNTLAQFHFNHGDIPAATALVTAILEARPGFFPTLMLDCEIKITEKNYRAALNQLQTLEKEHPDIARLHYLKGICSMELAETPKAITALARSVDLDPAPSGPRTLLAQLYYNAGNFDLARQHARIVLAQDPSNFQATDILANCDMEAGAREKAMEGFKKLVDMAPQSPRGYHLLGLFYAYEQKYEQSDQYLTQALERSPLALDVIGLLVRNLVNQKKYNDAHELIKKQLNAPNAPLRFLATLYKLSGDIYVAEKKQEEALNAFQKAVDADVDFQAPYYAMARILMQTGSPDKAIEQYTRLLEKNPGQVTAHMMLGILMDARGQYDEGATHYRKALEINPRYAPAANNLAYHLVRRTDKADEALSWARVAKEVMPEDPAIMDTLGLVFLKKGLMDSAITEFQDSLKQSDNNPVVMLHLGQAYHAKGDKVHARATLKEMMMLDQNQERLKQAAALLRTFDE